MASAILSLKQNRALLKKRNIRELKDLLRTKSGKNELEFKKVSPEELALIKKSIREQARKAAYQEVLIYIASTVLFLLSIGLHYLAFR